jgi:hypothetical protein
MGDDVRDRTSIADRETHDALSRFGEDELELLAALRAGELVDGLEEILTGASALAASRGESETMRTRMAAVYLAGNSLARRAADAVDL